MARYFSRKGTVQPRSNDGWWEEPFRPHIVVSDHEAVDTGLLDADGDPIWRAPNPVGFGRDDEW